MLGQSVGGFVLHMPYAAFQNIPPSPCSPLLGPPTVLFIIPLRSWCPWRLVVSLSLIEILIVLRGLQVALTGDGLLEASEGASLQICSSNCLMKCSQVHTRRTSL